MPITYRECRVAIVEREDCWMVDPPGGLHDTAAEALAWVRTRDERDVEHDGVSRVTILEWHPTTRIGKLVVSALTR